MTTIERLGKGLFSANLLTAADKAGIHPPTTLRLDRAWERNTQARKKWCETAARILAATPGIDLGAMTGQEAEEMPEPCPDWLERAAYLTTLFLAALVGAGVGAIVALYLHG